MLNGHFEVHGRFLKQRYDQRELRLLGKPRQEQARGPSGDEGGKPPEQQDPKVDEGMETSAKVGRTVRARAECGPACESVGYEHLDLPS